jgi:hypothetical protein
MAFVRDLFITDTFKFPGSLFNRPVNGVVGHTRRFSSGKGGAESGIGTQIAPTYASSNSEVFDELGK